MDEDLTTDPRTVTLEIRGPVLEVSQVRGWVTGRASGLVDSTTVDLPDGTVQCRMSVVVVDEQSARP